MSSSLLLRLPLSKTGGRLLLERPAAPLPRPRVVLTPCLRPSCRRKVVATPCAIGSARAFFSSSDPNAASFDVQKSTQSQEEDETPGSVVDDSKPASSPPPPYQTLTPRASNPRSYQDGVRFSSKARYPGRKPVTEAAGSSSAAALSSQLRTGNASAARLRSSHVPGRSKDARRKPKKPPQSQSQPQLPPNATVAEWILAAATATTTSADAHAAAAGKKGYRRRPQHSAPIAVPNTSWIRVDNISPTSSLEALVAGMWSALERHGVINLDAPWNPDEMVRSSAAAAAAAAAAAEGGDRSADDGAIHLPALPVIRLEDDYPDGSWIVQARVVLSPFARPTGWHVQLASRSLAYALLSAAQDEPLLCASRPVTVRAMDASPGEEDEKDDGAVPMRDRLRPWPPEVSDATIRVENCSERTSVLELLNLFSRYDLRHPPRTTLVSDGQDGSTVAAASAAESASVVPWTGITSDGKAPPTTWLVHFRNAGWARAALRDVQGATLDGRILRLARYPRQKLAR